MHGDDGPSNVFFDIWYITIKSNKALTYQNEKIIQQKFKLEDTQELLVTVSVCTV